MSFFQKILKAPFYIFYYYFAQYLPNSYDRGIVGKISNKLRVMCCHHLFKKCGRISTINRRVCFGTGTGIEMGDGSGIGEHTTLPPDTLIGKIEIIGRYTFILGRNHKYEDLGTPIVKQGFHPSKQTIIEDDCWIGLHTLFTPGRHVKRGTIIAMGKTSLKIRSSEGLLQIS